MEYQQVGQRALLNYIHQVAGNNPHKIAVHQLIAPDDEISGGRKDITLSYQNLVTLVDKLCWALHQRGVKPNVSRLAYLGPSDLRHLLIALAANKLGTTALLLSPRGTNSIYEHLLAECSTSVLLYDHTLASTAEEVSIKARIDAFLVDDLLDLLGDLSLVKAYHPNEQTWKSLASTTMAILHTTGSTGMPKPVHVSHSALAAIDAQRLISQKDQRGIKCHLEVLAEAKTIYMAFPLFHVAGFELSCYFIFSGCTLLFGYPRQPPNISILDDALRVNGMDGALLPPIIIEDISRYPGVLAKISNIRWIFSGGGSISQIAGDAVVARTRLFNGLGSTECGAFIQYPTDPLHWNYYRFHPWNGIHWRRVDCDQDSTEFELVLRRESSLRPYQGVFHNFPNIDEWSTKDVFRPHPSIQDLWEYRYRIDDLVVFSTGEKMNPVPVETRVRTIRGVTAAIVIGNKQSYPGLLIELEGACFAHKSKGTIPANLKGSIEHAIQIMNSQSTRDAQIHPTALLIASLNKPFIRTPKGTVHRNKTLDLYSAEIQNLYDSIGSSQSAVHGDLRLDLSCEASLARDLTGIIQKILPVPTLLRTTDDMFAAGLDSKHTQVIVSVLGQALTAQAGRDNIARLETVYRNPTTQKLARSILNSLSSPRVESQDRMRNFYEILGRYAKNIPVTRAQHHIADLPNTHKHVLLTGSTGFVGSYTLQALLRQKKVGRVTCLNRNKGHSSQTCLQQFHDHSVHVEYLQTDLAEVHFGLSKDIYRQLLSSITDIIHCQWAVDFNRPIEHFEPNIQGVENLIHFSHASQRAAHLIFLSSIATVKAWDRSTNVPEERLTSPSYARTGYGESKLIASLLLDRASESARISSSICRLGQVAGPVRGRTEMISAHAWPERDWVPTLLRSAVELGCLPNTLCAADEIDWIPVDLVAELLCDLVCSDRKNSRTTSQTRANYYHIVNPHRTRYSDLVRFLADRLRPLGCNHVVPLERWVALLTEQGLSGQKNGPPTGIELLSFFQSLASSGDGERPIVLETEHTMSELPRLADVAAVGEEWLGLWLDQLGLVSRNH